MIPLEHLLRYIYAQRKSMWLGHGRFSPGSTVPPKVTLAKEWHKSSPWFLYYLIKWHFILISQNILSTKRNHRRRYKMCLFQHWFNHKNKKNDARIQSLDFESNSTNVKYARDWRLNGLVIVTQKYRLPYHLWVLKCGWNVVTGSGKNHLHSISIPLIKFTVYVIINWTIKKHE